MSSNQIIILSVFLGYLLFNVVVSFAYSKKAEKSLHTSEENKYFIGGILPFHGIESLVDGRFYFPLGTGFA